ncbi:hypothetical protein IFM89_004079, partial [Coptis chinensis]
EAAVVTATSAVQGAAIGGFMGTLTSDVTSAFPTPPEVALNPQAMASLQQALPCYFFWLKSTSSGVNAGISCVMKRIRGKEDVHSRYAYLAVMDTAIVALNVKKGAYAPLRSAFELDQIIEFVKEAGRGGKGNLPLESSPMIVETEPWDGKDGEIIEEDEFSLEELMGGDTASKENCNCFF